MNSFLLAVIHCIREFVDYEVLAGVGTGPRQTRRMPDQYFDKQEFSYSHYINSHKREMNTKTQVEKNAHTVIN